MAFDDHLVEEYLDPPLTIIRMPMRTMGSLAVSMLFQRLRGEDIQHVIAPDPSELVIRASTAAPAGAASVH